MHVPSWILCQVQTQMCIILLAGLLAGETHYTCHRAWHEELYSVTAISWVMYGEWNEAGTVTQTVQAGTVTQTVQA